jgi:hypothetical protein
VAPLHRGGLPILQERGVVRTEYESTTLRGNLGLPGPGEPLHGGPPRFQLQKKLLQQPGAEAQDYGEQVDDILALLRGTYRSADGVDAHAGSR